MTQIKLLNGATHGHVADCWCSLGRYVVCPAAESKIKQQSTGELVVGYWVTVHNESIAVSTYFCKTFTLVSTALNCFLTAWLNRQYIYVTANSPSKRRTWNHSTGMHFLPCPCSTMPADDYCVMVPQQIFPTAANITSAARKCHLS